MSASPTTSLPETPSTLNLLCGAYRVDTCVTVGRSSMLLLAHQAISRAPGVLKLMATRSAMQSLSARAEATRALPERFFPRIFDHGHIKGVPYVWMEEVVGWNIYDLIVAARSANWGLNQAFAIYILTQIAEMLVQVEAARREEYTPFLGRVTPASLRMMADGSIRFVGLCHLMDGPMSGSAVAALPQEGPAMLAPEQLNEHRATPGTDSYGWAMTAYMLLTGENPVVRKGTPAVRQMIREPIPMEPIQQCCPAMVPILQAALQADPDQRPKAVELLEALQALDIEAMSAASAVHIASTLLGPVRPVRAGPVTRQRCLMTLERLDVHGKEVEEEEVTEEDAVAVEEDENAPDVSSPRLTAQQVTEKHVPHTIERTAEFINLPRQQVDAEAPWIELPSNRSYPVIRAVSRPQTTAPVMPDIRRQMVVEEPFSLSKRVGGVPAWLLAVGFSTLVLGLAGAVVTAAIGWI